MALITFQDLPNTTTPLNASNLNNNFTECNNIVESGSNANGNYIKFSDGTMICRTIVSLGQQTFTAYGSSAPALYVVSGGSNYTWTFPQEFYDTNVTVSAILASSGYTNTSMGWANNTKCIIYFSSNYSFTSYLTLHITAIGRWRA